MKLFRYFIFALASIAFISTIGGIEFGSVVPKPAKVIELSNYSTIEWVSLLPKDQPQARLNTSRFANEIEHGSKEDQMSSPINNQWVPAADDTYQQSLASTNPEMNNRQIRIPGYIVPLMFGEERRITQFYLVPFFGACIHVPPPPPNQIIFVHSQEGIDRVSSSDAFWVSGKLETTLTESETATSAYSMKLHHIELYNN